MEKKRTHSKDVPDESGDGLKFSKFGDCFCRLGRSYCYEKCPYGGDCHERCFYDVDCNLETGLSTLLKSISGGQKPSMKILNSC